MTTDKPIYSPRDKVTMTIKVSGNNLDSIAGNLSVAVTDEKDVAVDTMNTLFSSFFLSSELRGHIEYPAYYFLEGAKSELALDLLMMTHCWRRYDIPEVIKGNMYVPKIDFELYKNIIGRVKTLLMGKPLPNCEVSMFSTIGLLDDMKTDSIGRFGFWGFDYPDSARIIFQAKNPKRKTQVEISVNPDVFPKIKHAPFIYSHTDSLIINEEDYDFFKKSRQRAEYDEDMRVINLPEVEISGKKSDKADKMRLQFAPNATSDITIYRNQFENTVTHVSDILLSIAGVRIGTNGVIYIRGAKSPPLVLIDGVRQPWPADISSMTSIYESPLEQISPDDVETVDVFKGSKAAFFGFEGSNGAISITTRKGGGSANVKRVAFNHIEYRPLGYQKPAEFYAPKYDTPEAKNLSNPDYRTTIFWKPDAVLSNDDTATVEFYTSDFPTTYTVEIEGLTSDGKIIRDVEKISVQ